MKGELMSCFLNSRGPWHIRQSLLSSHVSCTSKRLMIVGLFWPRIRSLLIHDGQRHVKSDARDRCQFKCKNQNKLPDKRVKNSILSES